MKLLAPCSFREIPDRTRWFKQDIAQKLASQKGIDFGFELKEPTESIKNPPPLYWGYHLPGNFANQWYYYPEKRKILINRLSHISFLKPNYAVLHGIHLYWHPPARKYRQRYVNHSQDEEYLKVIAATKELLFELKKLFGDNLKLENYPLYTHYTKNGQYLPETYLYTGSGRLDDLLYFKKETGVDILIDLEHLILTLNFLNRQRNYRHLPKQKVSRLTPETLQLKTILGFVVQKGLIPYLEKEITVEEMIDKIGAKFYHLTGSRQEITRGRITAHAPIKLKDKIFRQNLQLILAQKPKVLILEAASSLDGPEWHYLRPNETELSFYNLCKILLEEL